MTNQEILATLKQRSAAAFGVRQFEETNYFLELHYKFQRLLFIVVCTGVLRARLSQKPPNDAALEALFEALQDANSIINDINPEAEPS